MGFFEPSVVEGADPELCSYHMEALRLRSQSHCP
jgi:hypothetical protein